MSEKMFDVTITETLERVVRVSAESTEAAKAKVQKMYKDEEIVLGSEDWTGETDFDVFPVRGV